MSETICEKPSPPYLVVTKDINGHQVSAGFYPGFARTIEVNGVSLYDQKADGYYPFCLPKGEGPWTSSAMSLSSSKGYRVVLSLDDAGQAIDQLQLVLRPPKPTNGGGVTAFEDDADTWCISNTVVYCPPVCNP